MANTTLTQTGAQVQSILNKADKLPATVGTNGQVLTSDGTNLSWQTPQGGGGGGVTSINGVTGNVVIDDLNYSSYEYHFRILPNIPYKFDISNGGFGGPIYYLGYKESTSGGNVDDILFGYHYLSYLPAKEQYRYAIFIVLTSIGGGVASITGTLRSFDGTLITTSNISSYLYHPLLLYSDVRITYDD